MVRRRSYTQVATSPPLTSTVGSTHQRKPIKETQVQNSAGGYVFQLDKWKRLDRFLILGSDQPTYYVDEHKLTQENALVVLECAAEDAKRTAKVIEEISVKGRAYRNDPAIYALALMAKAGGDARRYSYAVVPAVVRTGRMWLDYHTMCDDLGVKSHRSRRTMIEQWYAKQTASGLAYQHIKYPPNKAQKWSHRDIMRFAHPELLGEDVQATVDYIVHGKVADEAPTLIHAWEAACAAKTEGEMIALIQKHGLTWEFVPGQFQGSTKVWQALLPNLPARALVNNLGRLSSYDILTDGSEAERHVINRLGDVEMMRRARMHPLAFALAHRIYEEGHGMRGNLTWKPAKRVVSALEQGFYNAFGRVEPSNKRYMLALDVSGSMAARAIRDLPFSCAELTAYMAMLLLRTEEDATVMGFAHEFRNLHLSPAMTLKEASKNTVQNNFGGTDASIPMRYAGANQIPVDEFVIMTDSETWYGEEHPCVSLQKYREASGIPAKLVVVGMTSTGFTIADPNTDYSLDVVGFDTDTPGLITAFASAE